MNDEHKTSQHSCSSNTQHQPNYKTLVLSGGGSKGLIHLGSLEFVWQMGYIRNVVDIWGVSVGSIIALFLVLEYTPQEIFQMFFRKGILRMGDITDFDIMALMPIECLGDRLIDLVDYRIDRKTTFRDIHNNYKKLNIVGCCKDNEIDKQEIFNFENTPEMSVIDAIEISSALPFIFTDKIYNYKKYIDGCFVNDLPVDLAYEKNRRDSILAIWIKSDGKTDYNLLNDIYQLLTIPMNHMQLLRNRSVPENIIDIIDISSPGAGFASLNPDRKKQVEMWGEGFRAAEDFYSKKFHNGWEF